MKTKINLMVEMIINLSCVFLKKKKKYKKSELFKYSLYNIIVI